MFGVYIVVQFYHWFKFYFLLFQTHCHTLPYPNAKEKKISTKDKIEPQHMIYYASQSMRRTFSDNMELHALYVGNLEIAYSVLSLEVDRLFQLLLERDPL